MVYYFLHANQSKPLKSCEHDFLYEKINFALYNPNSSIQVY